MTSDCSVSSGNFKANREYKEKVEKETCWKCGSTFKVKNWHTPSECPVCKRSRVE